MSRKRLALFDLDNTLLSGDSDVLWCDFLIRQGLLDRDEFSALNASMDARYKAGTVPAREFCEFYVGTLAGRSPVDWEPVRQQFLNVEIIPRIPHSALEVVGRHRDAGDLIALTTATNRFTTELTARYLQIDHLIATEPEMADGIFTGRTAGQINMREGKVQRLRAWLEERGATRAEFEITAYSDSVNDLPLLSAADIPVAVNPDQKLARWAVDGGHQVLILR